MKRYDGRAKPIPKARPVKKKGVSQTNKYKRKAIWFKFVFWGETVEPKDPSRISSTSATLRIHVPRQVLKLIIAILVYQRSHIYRCRPCNDCYLISRAVFKKEKIATVIHPKEVKSQKKLLAAVFWCSLFCDLTMYLFCSVYSVSYILVCRWTSSRWRTATCWSPTWTGWDDRRSRRPRKPPSNQPCRMHPAPMKISLKISKKTCCHLVYLPFRGRL